MPRKNGFDVLRAIRRVSAVPVIILTARDEDLAEVRGLELGADDYLVKPFSPLVLLARVKAVLRRAEQSGTPPAVPTMRRVAWRSASSGTRSSCTASR